MSKTRYAKFPLQCDALKKADEAVFAAMKKDGKEPRKLNMGSGDYKYRKLWMDAYFEAGGEDSVQDKKPKRKPGDAVSDCKNKPRPKPTEPVATATLIVTVLDGSDKNKPIFGAQVEVSGGMAGFTAGNGEVIFSDVPTGFATAIAGQAGFAAGRMWLYIREGQVNKTTFTLLKAKKMVRRPVQFFIWKVERLGAVVFEKTALFDKDLTKAVYVGAPFDFHQRLFALLPSDVMMEEAYRQRIKWVKPSPNRTAKSIGGAILNMLGTIVADRAGVPRMEIDLVGDVKELTTRGIKPYRSWTDFQSRNPRSFKRVNEKFGEGPKG
jgi:hypothetical protein